MGSIFNEDFRDFIHALNQRKVKYILVGGYAVILHGYRRVTGDMDIWVERSGDNYKKLATAFNDFQLPVFDMTLENFMNPEVADVFSFGRPPVSIDIITELKGVSFEEAFLQAEFFNDEGLSIRFLHLNNLLAAKKAAGRYKDLDDIEKLTSGK